MSGALVWIHVLAGVIWIGACACLALAAAVLTAGSDEFSDFALSGVPRLIGLNATAAALLLAAGVAKLGVIGVARRFHFSSLFLEVLSVKAALFAAMVAALAGSWRARRRLAAACGRPAPGRASARPAGRATADPAAAAAEMNRITLLSIITAAMGAAALTLGLWLAGS